MKPSPGRDETPAVPRPLLPIAAAALIAVLAAGCGASHQATATTTAPDGRTHGHGCDDHRCSARVARRRRASPAASPHRSRTRRAPALAAGATCWAG